MPTGRTQFGPYQIVSRLGAGGMGEVYRAHDARLGRDVALKIIAPQHALDPAAVRRMIEEARIAAALEHPAIVAVYDVGDQDGEFYLVTELVDGETLRTRLRQGTLTTRAALEYAMAIASGLAAAHNRGIIHRDLKPENIMLTAAGGVKILDFGVAKRVAVADAATASLQTPLTAKGQTVGTPAYMAPEQLSAGGVDHRADQFSFGVVLYEMLAGRRPFTGTTASEITASILRDDPPPLGATRPDVPSPVARLVNRCLAKDPGQRYASTTDLAHVVADARADLDVLSTPLAQQAEPRRIVPPWVAVAGLIGAVAIVAALGWPRAPAADPRASRSPAVAVLPFTTIGNAEAYLADGLTEAVTRELGHIEGMRVIASSSAFTYRGRSEGFRQIAADLGVAMMVRGSIQRERDRLRIVATLIDARDDATLWTNNYDREMDDMLAVQDDIAWQVAAKLADTLGSKAPPRRAQLPKTNPDAYDAYLRGLNYLRGGSAGFGQAITELERAVALDPGFALGRARLASAYTQQFFYNSTDPALEQKAFVEIERALAINPDLAEAYLARAQLVWNLRNGFPHERAIADVRTAIANNPSLAEAHIELGKFYLHIGLIDRSIAANQEALRLDPRSAAASQRIVAAKVDGGRTQELADELARNPQWSLRSRAAALSFLGRTDEAIAVVLPRGAAPDELKKIEMNEIALLAQLMARRHRRSDADRALALAIPLAANPTGLSDTHHAQFAIGCAYALLGDTTVALQWLTKAANEGYPSYPRFSSEPDLASLKDHPGFVALLQRLQDDHARWSKTL